MNIPNTVLEDIRIQIRPKEACGLLTKNLKVYPVMNVSVLPNTFVMDKTGYLKTLKRIQEAGEEVIAIYHTHPFCDSTPSSKDLEFFAKSNYDMLIVSNKDYTYYVKEHI